MTKDIDALVAAADALADAWRDYDSTPAIDHLGKMRKAHHEYRAAREAVRKGTPPAYATSA